jgi:hypothetical protein
MLLFHGVAAAFAILMLVRHVEGARRRQPVAIVTCLLARAVLAWAIKERAGRA